ncbi:hypothetical protein [Chryseobacterium salivictor]|nr:hypothetical protein [Chryseobacterium salivictor]
MNKALMVHSQQNHQDAEHNLGLPESLTGFDFNAHCPWEKITRFYPEFRLSDTRELECRFPALKAGREIVLPQDARSAELRLDAFTVNPLSRTINLNLISSHTADLSIFQATLPTVWKFGIPDDSAWLVVTGTLIFKSATPLHTAAVHGSSTYLFAKSV